MHVWCKTLRASLTKILNHIVRCILLFPMFHKPVLPPTSVLQTISIIAKNDAVLESLFTFFEII
jgi:hypothetical protein